MLKKVMATGLTDIFLELGAENAFEKRLEKKSIRSVLKLGNLSIVQEFVSRNQIGASDINDQVYGDYRMIDLACEYGHKLICEWLYEFGGNNKDHLKYEDSLGLTLMDVACEEGHISICKWLFEVGEMTTTDIKRKDNDGFDLMGRACSKGHLPICKWLFEVGEMTEDSITYNNNNGWTAMDLACKHGHLPICKWLLNVGNFNEDFIQGVSHGVTLMDLACSEGHLPICEWLFEVGEMKKGYINSFNEEGVTLMDLAFNNRHLSICKWLFKVGEMNDLKDRCRNGSVFLNLLKDLQYDDIIWLISKGVKTVIDVSSIPTEIDLYLLLSRDSEGYDLLIERIKERLEFDLTLKLSTFTLTKAASSVFTKSTPIYNLSDDLIRVVKEYGVGESSSLKNLQQFLKGVDIIYKARKKNQAPVPFPEFNGRRTKFRVDASLLMRSCFLLWPSNNGMNVLKCLKSFFRIIHFGFYTGVRSIRDTSYLK